MTCEHVHSGAPCDHTLVPATAETRPRWWQRRWFAASVAASLLAGVLLYLWVGATELANYSVLGMWRFHAAQTARAANVAVVWDRDDDSFWLGASLAAERLNASRRGRAVPIRLTRYSVDPDDEDRTARRIARSPSYVAVIGHSGSEAAELAAVSYEYTNLLFLAAGATDPTLTLRGFEYTFRTAPTDDALVDIVTSVVAPHDVAPLDAVSPPRARAGILYSESPHYVLGPVVETLVSALLTGDVDLAFQKPYHGELAAPRQGTFGRWSYRQFGGLFPGDAWRAHIRRGEALRANVQEAFRPVEGQLPPDRVIVLDDNPANAWRAIARVATTAPSASIVSPGTLDVVPFPAGSTRCESEYRLGADRATALTAPPRLQDEGRIYFAGIHCPGQHRELLATLRRRHPKPFRESAALQGYEAVQILGAAFASAESLAPADVAAVLRSGATFPALPGQAVTFDAGGDIKGKRFYLASVSSAAIPSRFRNGG